ncbi:branched chain amino acid ABC transporter substrate-binding protein [Streptomyces cinereoruber]|uniref:Branched-chain amino acid ABC transporter substrate-binding protein n=1 Tax=Streptomyces cinereoruber TaxID=67260 RepID=A0AAV4KKC9_9ACTN|nr:MULTISPECIES: branched-chain amino acid ABC transporter substrate-binding protein [Streptomyces]AVH97995.1 branched-chain amino acid ABC transporter substrate-binding protein [Streptomyces sp. WAC00288]KYG56584.1 branched chain amino acid ABC transporter substrate-binding protein [Streptomyces sp. WAC04657]MBB4161828.1 branched-chain amino acid transport system substrate-binding protein [Streptomyces cinereoruber]MBY8817122.1 branched-chain amino acid ABC transporter substrate-binding protei
MRHRSLLILTSVLTTGALTLTACGSRDDKGSSGDGNGGGSTTTVVIGVDAPLTGSLSALGQGIKNSVDLAVKTANKNNEVPGVTFKIEALDDQAVPASGQANATKLVGNKDVLGVVGPLNSGVSQQMQGVFAAAKLAQVSPANTNPALSQGDNWGKGEYKRPFATYFRTAATDVVQGKFAAQYLFKDAGKKKVYVVDDKQTYGAGLAAIFSDEFKRLGGQVVGTDHVTVKETDFSATADKVKSSGADSVYFGGQYPEGGLLSDQIKKTGAKIPVMGGDGIYDPAFISASAEANDGDLATSIGYPVEKLDTAKKFIADYNAGGYKDPYAAYGGYSYDAGWAIIQAVKAVVAANSGKLPSDARAKVTEALGKVSFDGVTGKVSFDEFGDTTNKQLTVYKVEGGKWIDVKSDTFNQ